MPTIRRAICVGAGQFALEVADVASQAGIEVIAFVEGLDRGHASLEAVAPVLWVDDQARFEPDLPLIVGIGAVARRPLIERLQAEGRRLLTVIHPSAVISATSSVGEGCVIFPGSIIGAHTQIGLGTIVNRGALIGHHCSIGRHCLIGPGANVAGRVQIGDEVTIAMSAIVRDGLTIADRAVVGACAAAVTDVAAETTVVGIPARPMVRRDG